MTEKESSAGNYQDIRNLLDTVEFIPLTPTPKQPSFGIKGSKATMVEKLQWLSL
jgi:hypothetical protein